MSGRGVVATVAAVAAAVGGVVTQSVGAPTAVQATALQQQLDNLLNDSRYDGSQVALVVRDATTGETLYDRNGDQRMLPASNTKLFTSTAAMHILGPSYRFHTDVLATAPVRGGQAARRPVPQGVRRPDRTGVRLRRTGQAAARGRRPARRR